MFGGRRSVPLRMLGSSAARVTVQVLRGGKVVRSFKARSARGGKTVRLRYPARKAQPRRPQVRITAVRGSRRTRATLTSSCEPAQPGDQLALLCERLGALQGVLHGRAPPRRSTYQGWNLRR